MKIAKITGKVTATSTSNSTRGHRLSRRPSATKTVSPIKSKTATVITVVPEVLQVKPEPLPRVETTVGGAWKVTIENLGASSVGGRSWATGVSNVAQAEIALRASWILGALTEQSLVQDPYTAFEVVRFNRAAQEVTVRLKDGVQTFKLKPTVPPPISPGVFGHNFSVPSRTEAKLPSKQFLLPLSQPRLS